MILETYQSRAKRDARAEELAARGLTVVRRSSRGSLLHPECVTDYKGTYVGQYPTYWPVLYHLEAK